MVIVPSVIKLARLALVGVVAALCACTSNQPGPVVLGPVDPPPLTSRPVDGGAGTASPSTAPGPSSTATATGYRQPDAATPQQEREVREVIERWFQVLNTSLRTLDPSVGRELYEPTCQSCKTNLDYYEGVATSGNTLEGGRLSITRMGPVFVQPDGQNASVQVFYTAEVMRERDKKRKIVAEEPRLEDWAIYEMRRGEQGWRIVLVRGPKT